MKTRINQFFGGRRPAGLWAALVLAACCTFHSCEKDEDEELLDARSTSGTAAKDSSMDGELDALSKSGTVEKNFTMDGILDVLFDTELVRETGKPSIESLAIGDFNLADYDPTFVLHVEAESVSSAVVRFGEELLLGTSDFHNGSASYSIPLTDLTEGSVLTVEQRGSPGSILHIWLEGKMTSFVDERDGTRYKVVQIGDQIWMAENLAWLPVVSPVANGSLTDKFYYVYGYDGTDVNEAKTNENYSTYGVLYNWPATDGAAPEGWHVASDAEWIEMEIYIGMSPELANSDGMRGTNEGTKLKASTSWLNDTSGTDEFGFNALGGGYRSGSGFDTFFGQGTFSNWWTSTPAVDPGIAYTRRVMAGNGWIGRSARGRDWAWNIRCIRD